MKLLCVFSMFARDETMYTALRQKQKLNRGLSSRLASLAPDTPCTLYIYKVLRGLTPLGEEGIFIPAQLPQIG